MNMQSLFQAGLILQITSARLATIVYFVVGLSGVIIGAWALASSARSIGRRRPGAIVALVAGLVGMLLSGLHLASSTSMGTGSGRLGAIVSLVVGFIGMVLGGLAFVRVRQ
jgi:hypothetical protein